MLKDKTFMNIAYEIASGSNCVSRQAGAVLVRDNRILSTGYNGTPAGYINCRDYWKGEYTKEHHEWSYKYEIHAEMNALIWAARNGIKIEGSTLYSTYQPCFDCSRAAIAAGIKIIIYREKYKHHLGSEAEDFITANGCETYMVNEK